MWLMLSLIFSSFFFNATATTEIYTLSLHDALPISLANNLESHKHDGQRNRRFDQLGWNVHEPERSKRRLRCPRSEEHTSELQSHSDLVCRLLLEKKKKYIKKTTTNTIKIITAYKKR